jgi:hypothetical protein
MLFVPSTTIGSMVVQIDPDNRHCTGAQRALQVLISRDGIHQNVLKIKPPLVFSRADADEMCCALNSACYKLLSCLQTVDSENGKCMEATVPGRAEASEYFDKLFQDYQKIVCRDGS